jgi:hypothetical protein
LQDFAMLTQSNKVTDAKIRRQAARTGWRACKSRDRTIHWNNHGGWMLLDAYSNTVIYGADYDVSDAIALELLAERMQRVRDGSIVV